MLHKIAVTPINMSFLVFLANLPTHIEKNWAVSAGGLGRPKVQLMIFQIYLAKGHSKNKWSILSSAPQNMHFLSPTQPLWPRLSLVRMLRFITNQRKILSLRGSLKGIYVGRQYSASLENCKRIWPKRPPKETTSTPIYRILPSVSHHCNLL